MKTTTPGPRLPGLRALSPLAACLCALAGCTLEPDWVGAPRVPSPVLLGPVDRVGGHRTDEKAEPTGRFDAFMWQAGAGRRSESRAGDGAATEERSIAHEGTALLSAEVLRATEARGDRDARVQSLDASASAVVRYDFISVDRSVGVSGDVVRAAGGAK